MPPSAVIPGLGPGIHAFNGSKDVGGGTSPAMTVEGVVRV
jgi:hypothetical protein